jgi:esterase/lipase superfamily enzyme
MEFEGTADSNPLAREVRLFGQALEPHLTKIRSSAAAALWLVVLAGLASVPLFQTQFSFRELFGSRLLLAASMFPLARLIEPLFVSRFNLRRFRIDPGAKDRFSARVGNLMRVELGWGGLIGLSLAGLVFFVDPIGLYASGHSKALVSVFYITDRQANPSGSPAFTTEGSPTEEMSYGSAEVPITWNHGDIIRNLNSVALLSWTKTTISLQGMDEASFYNSVEAAIGTSDHHEAFLFIHGFHNTFDEALARTAGLSYDLKFQGPKLFRGVSILYSWPAGTSFMSYDHDKDNALWSVDHLKGVLARLAQLDPAYQLHIIAHSMGSRVLAGAVKSLQASNVAPGRFKNIVFAAADLDQQNFQQASPELKGVAERVTVYVSGRDIALGVSSALHEETRIGFKGTCRDGMDVIDTEGQDTSAQDFYHGYLFDSQPVLYDLGGVLRGLPPEGRVGIAQAEGKCFWVFEHR